MKNLLKISMLILLICIFAGCSRQEKTKELLPVSGEDFVYTVSERTAAYTVDEEGLLYTVEGKAAERHKTGEPINPKEREYTTQIFEIYDLEGNCINHQELKFGYGAVTMMTIDDEVLYCVVPVDLDKYVYLVDTTTWQAVELTKLIGYQFVDKMVVLDEYLYILGTGEEAATKSYILHPEVYVFSYDGEQICRFNLTEQKPKQERMKVDFPIGMYATEEDTLMIYQYTEENAFGFLEFNPSELSLTEMEWHHVNAPRTNIGECGEGYIYTDEYKLYYGTTDGTEAQILPDKVTLTDPSVYQKGFLFLMDRENMGWVKRICEDTYIKSNKEIQVLSNQIMRDVPFGCGYQMNLYPASNDEFTLKALAQDKDFDVYLLSSREDCANNLQKNGAFYALNEVEGVQEYLDASFPYVKELAINEDGDIWMVPVALAIPGIVYNKELCEKNKVDYSQMSLLDFMELLKKIEAENPEQASMALIMLIEEFHMQYLSKYESFDTELARNYLQKLRKIYETCGEWGVNDVYGRSLIERTVAEFYVDYNVYSTSPVLDAINELYGDSNAYGFAGTPKLENGIRNVGTVTFLAVNPKSENLEDTLKYISEFCKYMLTKQNSFILQDEAMYEDTQFVKEQYQLYANGDINFRMEYEIFLEDFGAYIRGEIGLEETITEVERKRKLYVGE